MSNHQRRSRADARQDNRDTLARDAAALARHVVAYCGTREAATRLALAVIDHLGDAIDPGLEGDIALRDAACRLLAKAAAVDRLANA